MVSAVELVAQLVALGVRPGAVLQVHTSFRAVRPVEGGPAGLVAALQRVIGPEGTLVMPTMTSGESPFDRTSTPSLHMGVVAETFWRLPGVSRSGHPGASFAAAGPHAARICAEQPLEPPHGMDSPVGRVFELGGQVLLLGVEHSEDTMVHLAEDRAGVPYGVTHPTVVVVRGEPVLVPIRETDHCCMGFRQVDAWLGARQRLGPVGHATARLAEAADIVSVAVEHLRRDPLVFLCPEGAACEECDLARASAHA